MRGPGRHLWGGGRRGDSRYPDEEYSITLSFGCAPARVEELTQVIFAQINSLKTLGPGEIYIEKVKEVRKHQREVALKENSFWVNNLQWADNYGVDSRLLVRYATMVDSLDVAAVQAATQQYFKMDNYVRVVLYPENGAERAGD